MVYRTNSDLQLQKMEVDGEIRKSLGDFLSEAIRSQNRFENGMLDRIPTEDCSRDAHEER